MTTWRPFLDLWRCQWITWGPFLDAQADLGEYLGSVLGCLSKSSRQAVNFGVNFVKFSPNSGPQNGAKSVS